MPAHAVQNQPRELFGRRRTPGVLGEDLGLDVELELAARGQREDFIESWDRRTRNWRLLGKLWIAERATVPPAQFRQGERADRAWGRPGPWQMAGLSSGSCETTRTSSLVTAMSSSSTSTPALMAYSKADGVLRP